MEKKIDILFKKDYEFRTMLAKEMIKKTIGKYENNSDDRILNHIKNLFENIDNLSKVDVFENGELFDRFMNMCLMKPSSEMYTTIKDMFLYNMIYIDKGKGDDDFVNNVLEYAIQEKDLDFLKNHCFQFIIDVLFPNKIYDRIRATLICMGKDINEVDEWYNWIKKEED